MDGSHPGFVHKDIDRVFLGLGLVFILDLDFWTGLFNGSGLWIGLFNGLDLDLVFFRIWTWTGFSRNVDLKNRDSEFNEPVS